MMKLLTDLFGSLKAGWLQYADGGMYLGLFFVALLFLWLLCYDKLETAETGNGKKMLFLYSLIITVLVLFPVSAFFLLKYQTSFFTYSQLFLLIPMTPVMAWAFTEAFEMATVKLGKDRKVRPKTLEVLVVFGAAFLIFMAGNVSPASEPTNQTKGSVKMPAKVEEVLSLVVASDLDLETELLVAPEEVLEYARAYSGEIKLLYGRNLWQKELNAYTYDTYPAELTEVHEWLNPDIHTHTPVSMNITSEEALHFIELSGGTVLILEKAQFADEAVSSALEQAGYDKIAETADYVIVKR